MKQINDLIWFNLNLQFFKEIRQEELEEYPFYSICSTRQGLKEYRRAKIAWIRWPGNRFGSSLRLFPFNPECVERITLPEKFQKEFRLSNTGLGCWYFLQISQEIKTYCETHSFYRKWAKTGHHVNQQIKQDKSKQWHPAALTKKTNRRQMDKTLKRNNPDSKRKFDKSK